MPKHTLVEQMKKLSTSDQKSNTFATGFELGRKVSDRIKRKKKKNTKDRNR